MEPSRPLDFGKGHVGKEILSASVRPDQELTAESHGGLLRAIAREAIHVTAEIRELASGIYLVMEPGTIQSWAEFSSSAPPHSIALDGRVSERTCFDLQEKKWNYDHHVGVDRVSASATCRQVFDAVINNGLFSHLIAEDGRERIFIHVKEPDPDVGFAVCFLKNHGILERGGYSVKLSPLLEWEDRFDRFCGVVRCDPDNVWVKKLAWVCEPYEEARMHDQRNFAKLNGAEMADIVEKVGSRLEGFLKGHANGDCRTLDTRFDIIGGGEGWNRVFEQGFYARVGLANGQEGLGKEGCISVRLLGEDRWVYTIMKISPFSSFPIQGLYRVFNAAENIEEGALYRWGGCDFGGGSPYQIGSKLSPDQIGAITNAFLGYIRRFGADEDSVGRFIRESLPQMVHTPCLVH